MVRPLSATASGTGPRARFATEWWTTRRGARDATGWPTWPTCGLTVQSYLSRWSAEHLEAIALALNNRPRKTLGWKTPAGVFDQQHAAPNNPVLQRPIEPAQYRAIRYTERLAEAEAVASAGPKATAMTTR